MQIDKDDRYVSDPSHKTLAPSKGSSIFKQLLKPRAMILILVVALLMLIFIMSLSLNKEDNSWVVPPKVDKTQSTSTTNNNSSKSIDLKLPSISPEKTAEVAQVSTAPTTTATQPKASTPAPVETPATQTNTAEEKPVEEQVQPEKIASPVPATVTPQPVTQTATPNNNQEEKKQTTVANRTEKQPSTTNNRKDEKMIIPNNHFSIQLVGSTSLENVKKLITEYNLKNTHIYETVRNDKPWYVLIQGDFLTLEAARESIKSLPEEFQKNKAWAKAGSVINKEMAMSLNQPN